MDGWLALDMFRASEIVFNLTKMRHGTTTLQEPTLFICTVTRRPPIMVIFTGRRFYKLTMSALYTPLIEAIFHILKT